MEQKRAANIAAKDEARKSKNAGIKEGKQEKAAIRAQEKEVADKNEKERNEKQQALNAKREQNIAKREQRSSAGVSKKDIETLSAVYQRCDKNGDGTLSQQEFLDYLREVNRKSAPVAGKQSTAAQRASAKEPSIADQAVDMFNELDKDGDGAVTFRELLFLIYGRSHTEAQIDKMDALVKAEPEPEPEQKAELDPESLNTIKALFKSYDKDKSGTLTEKEMAGALKETGVDKDDIKQYFKDFSCDGTVLTFEDFVKLMESTDAF